MSNISKDIVAKDVSARSRWPLLLALCVLVAGLGLTVQASRLLQDVAADRAQAELEAQASALVRELTLAIDLSLESLYSVRAYIRAQDEPESERFARFVAADAATHPGTLALGWAPRVTEGGRAAFERWLSQRTGRAETIHEETGHGLKRALPAHEVYFPVHSLATREGDSLGAGLDMASVKGRQDAITRTLRSSEPSALKVRRADAWGPDGDQVTQAFLRVDVAPVTGGVDEPAGVAFGVFSVGALFRSVLAAADPGVRIWVFDRSAPAVEQRLYGLAVNDDPASIDDFLATRALGEPLVERVVRFADREWVMYLQPGVDPGLLARLGLPLAGLVGGVVVTVLLSLYLFVALARGRQLEWLSGRVGAMQRDLIREQVDAALERSLREQADAAASARSHFLQTASHDVRQPLHALGLYVNLLGERPALAADPSFMARLHSAADGLQGLFDALLDLGRLEAGALQPLPRVFDPSALLNRLADEAEALAHRRGLVLLRRLEPVTVLSDPLLLERAVRNLLVNALRCTDRGWVALRCVRRGGEVRISVIDSGPGIAADRRAHLFEPHLRGRRTEGQGEGLGLGLSIVRQMCGLLGHRFTLHSRPGRGSAFSLVLSCAADAQVAAEPLPASSDAVDAALPAFTIWLVDDDALVRDASARQLEQWGVRVRTFACGAELRAALDGPPPDAMLADCHLPDADGRALIAEVRARFGEALPALLLTGDSTVPAGAGLPVLRKPLNPLKLKSALNALQAGPVSRSA